MLEKQCQRLRGEILSKISENPQEAEKEIDSIIGETVRREEYLHPMTYKDREEIEKYLYQSLRCYGVIQDLIDDEEVTEIMVNGPKQIFYEKGGRIHPWELHFYSEEQLRDLIQQIVGHYDRRVNAADPIVDTRLPDGSRVHVVLPPVSVTGPALTIRKFTKKIMGLEALQESGTFPPWVRDYLSRAVQERKTIFISGGTGSGKTTLLNALTECISEEERVITIEDSKELVLKNCPNQVSLECKPPNMEGEGEITIRDLLKASLRMRPNRIIVGEVRGKECLDLLQALNTGHRGSISTGHGNSCEDMIHRLETMALMGMDMPIGAIRSQIACGIQLFIHMERDKEGKRYVEEIKTVKGVEKGKICLETVYGRSILR